jgi:quinolinate synthase
MFQEPLPPQYLNMSPEEAADHIGKARDALGKKLVILGHHYQRDEVIRWADYRGDSLKLSQIAANVTDADYFVFCGVHFMAETADILTRPDQTVILPNMAAGCSMADMARLSQVEDAWRQIEGAAPDVRITPITYVNSAADLKAFVGARGGACCTSSNARQVLEWALPRADKVFFFPDQHLGRNTCAAMGMDPEKDMVLWKPYEPHGGVKPEDLRRARVILWDGFCSVHQRFTVAQIRKARQEHSEVRIIVHPECSFEVVKEADLCGSTEYILNTVRGAEPASVWGIGTEINLVKRMANEMPDRTVFCLDPVECPCRTMYSIHPRYLAWALDNLAEGKVVNRVSVPEPTRSLAGQAVARMLEIT